MTRYQILLFPSLAAAIFVLGGALQQKPAASQTPTPTPLNTAADPRALDVLDKAAEALAPERVAWLETKVWQQSRCEDFCYQACGRLVLAPGERCRFDLNVKVGNSLGELRLINDGKIIWQSMRIAGEEVSAKRLELPILNDTLKTPEAVAQARSQLIRVQGMAGLAPILRSLRKRMQYAQLQRSQWHGQEVHFITAGWPDNDAVAGGGDFVQPRVAPRQCRLYLDAQTLWPHRIEWWGAAKPGQADQLVMETEYRTPILNQPFSEERCAAEFACPGQ